MMYNANSSLKKLCREFIDRNEITDRKIIYQSDHGIEGVYEFIESICKIVGYSIDNIVDEEGED